MTGPLEEGRQDPFEAVVGLMLESLENIFLESAEVERKPRIQIEESEAVELAFELTYTMADRPYRWLIECERQAVSEADAPRPSIRSQEAVERLIAARPSQPDYRLILLYHLDQVLADDLNRTLDREGIDRYSLMEFGIRLDEINCALAADTGQDKGLFRLELMKSSRQFPALRGAFSKMRFGL